MKAMMPQQAGISEVDGARVVEKALEYAAKKIGRYSSCCAIAGIAEGNLDAYLYFRYGLAKESIAQAASICDGLEEAHLFLENRCENIPGEPVLVGVIASRKTAALAALLDSICEAVNREVVERIPALRDFKSVLAVEVLDPQEVISRKGLGALMGSVIEPPIQIWPQQ